MVSPEKLERYKEFVEIHSDLIDGQRAYNSEKALDPQKLTYFLQNYNQERSHIGSVGGEEVREFILAIMANRGESMKLSDITQTHNQQTDRRLRSMSLIRHLRFLIQQGLVKEDKRGYYSLV